MVDRLIGLAFGAALGALAYLMLMGVASFMTASQQPVLGGISSALLLGLCIWGWHNGSYALGRCIAWLRHR